MRKFIKLPLISDFSAKVAPLCLGFILDDYLLVSSAVSGDCGTVYIYRVHGSATRSCCCILVLLVQNNLLPQGGTTAFTR